MRLVHVAAVGIAALLLASAASAQGLGDAAAKEKQKRKASPTPKPAKVYTEGDLGSTVAPAATLPEQPAPTGDGTAAKPAGEGGAAAAGAGGASEAEKAVDEAKAKAEADWKKRLDQAHKEEGVYKDMIDKLQLELNDTSGGFYNPGRAQRIALQDENKQLLAQVQGRIAALEEEGRRNSYR